MTAARTTFEQNLGLLNDVLARSPIAGRTWVIGGLLLGWAREGRVLAHDDRDADFGFLRDDREAFLATVPALLGAGFAPLYRWISNAGEPVEYSLQKDGAKFEFFQHREVDGQHECLYFGKRWEQGRLVRLEFTSRVPAQPRSTMEFLGRTWHKPQDHEAFLTAVYGDWRVPRPAHDYTSDDRSVIAVHPWSGTWEWKVP